MIQEFVSLLEKMKVIHEKKNKDYAAQGNPFENFEQSAQLAEWFNDPVDKSFVNLIGTKLARLATLLNSGNKPNNESIEDSFLDLCTYCALWASYRERNKVTSIVKDVKDSLLTSCPLCMGEIRVSDSTMTIGDGKLYHTICIKNKSDR